MPRLNQDICLGCDVCALKCKPQAIRLVKREQRVIHPENTFERIILQCLERGTLQNQFFDEPGKISHQVMRGILGGFLRLPPVKKALMSERPATLPLPGRGKRRGRQTGERLDDENLKE